MTACLAIDTDLQAIPTAEAKSQLKQAWSGRPLAASGAGLSGTLDLVRQQVVVSPTGDPHEVILRVQEAVKAGAPAVVRLFPGPHGDGFPLATWVLEPLTALCERDGFALAVDYGTQVPAPLLEVDSFARLAPEVPVLLLGAHLQPSLGSWRLLDRCPNMLLEISPGTAPELVRDATDRFGAHRFVFGSRGHDVPGDFLVFLDPEVRETVLLTCAERLDARTWRDVYL